MTTRSHLIRIPYDLGPFSVLIADDDEGCRESVAEVMERAGHHPIAVPDGRAALEVVKTRFIHMTILDVNMPDLDGLETFRLLQKRFRALPVLFMTADTEQEPARRAVLEGAFRLLSKPINAEVLRQSVEQALLQVHVFGRLGVRRTDPSPRKHDPSTGPSATDEEIPPIA